MYRIFLSFFLLRKAGAFSNLREKSKSLKESEALKPEIKQEEEGRDKILPLIIKPSDQTSDQSASYSWGDNLVIGS